MIDMIQVGSTTYDIKDSSISDDVRNITAEDILKWNNRKETHKLKSIAHRGAMNEEPENTVASFRQAGIQGFWGCETDIQVTSDGYIVCHHDDTVDRMTDGSGSVASQTLAQVQALTIDGGANIANYTDLKIPTFEEYLQVCYMYSMVPVIEIKIINELSNLDTMLNTLKEYGFENNAIVISFNTDYLEYVRSKSDIPIQALLDLTEANINYCAENKFDIDVPFTDSFDLVKLAHSKGVKVNMWNTSTPYEVRTVLHNNCDYVTINSMKYYFKRESNLGHTAKINNIEIYNDYEMNLLLSSTISSLNKLKIILCHGFGSSPVPTYPLGYNNPSVNRATCYDMIKPKSTSSVNYTVPSGYSVALHQYDSSGKFLVDGGWKTGSGSITPNTNCSFIVPYFKKSDNTFITDYDFEQMKKTVIE